jgi:diacylglycerol kinase (ATP)
VNAAVIINPISGSGGRPDVARQRAGLAAAALNRHGIDGDVFVTERAGQARDLARAVLARGARLVIAWGGDGTVNEVGSELAYRDATLAIVPSGSGNGLSRDLQIPFSASEAFDVAFTTGRDVVIDAGELDGRMFFNIAGIGLDARVAHRFAVGGLVRRGFWRYLEITAQELFTYDPDEHTVVVDGVPERSRALIVAIANARQYGNGAIIAPNACLDDGRLDVVVVEQRSIIATLLQVPQVFRGKIDRLPGVSIRRGEAIEITSARPVIYHIDGEPFVGGASVRARVRPNALKLRVPR